MKLRRMSSTDVKLLLQNETVDWISLFPSLSSVELWESCCDDRSEWIAPLRSKGITPTIHNLHYHY